MTALTFKQRKLMMKQILILTFTTFLLAACSNVPNLDDYAHDPDAMWEQGKKQSNKGEKLIIKGEKLLEQSRQEFREGEELIQLSSDAILKARQDYQLEATRIGDSTSPKEIEFEADRLIFIGEKWEDAIDDVKKGNAMVEKSKQRQTEAQAYIKEGREAVELGSNFIRNSQRLRLSIPLLDSPSKAD